MDDLGTQLYELIEEARERLLARTSEADLRIHELRTEMVHAANHTKRVLKEALSDFEQQQNDLRFLAEKLVSAMTLQIPDYSHDGPPPLPNGHAKPLRSEQYAEQITGELH